MQDAPKFEDVRSSLFERDKIDPGMRPPLFEQLRTYMIKWFPSMKYTEDDLYFMKAKERLAKEMDLKQFIYNNRAARNSLKFLTTRQERRLVRMQADRNVLFLEDGEKQILADGTELTLEQKIGLNGDSSEFASGDYEEYVTSLQTQVNGNLITLSERENKLLSGLHLKQKEVANLISLGLGGILKKMKEDKAKERERAARIKA